MTKPGQKYDGMKFDCNGNGELYTQLVKATTPGGSTVKLYLYTEYRTDCRDLPAGYHHSFVVAIGRAGYTTEALMTSRCVSLGYKEAFEHFSYWLRTELEGECPTLPPPYEPKEKEE